jgi:hypothetical protein
LKGLTNANDATSPTDYTFLQRCCGDKTRKEFSAMCELDPVPPEGRKLESIRVYWKMKSSRRNTINVKFEAGFKNADGEYTWEVITEYLSTDKEPRQPGVYKKLDIPFPSEGDSVVQNFDAIRFTDGNMLKDRATTPIVEIDVFTAPLNS